MRTNFKPPLLLASLLLTSCAATSPEAIRQLEVWRGISANAKTCCESLKQVTADAPNLAPSKFNFGADTRHFDFGFGLAPFQAFRIDGATRIIEVESPVQRLSMAQGGDGVVRCFGPELLFFGPDAERRSGKLLDSSQRFNGDRDRSCYYYFEVPQGSVSMVLTTDPSKNLKRNVGLIKSAPTEPLTSKTKTFFVFAGLNTDGHKSTVYGPVSVRALPTE